jgi:ceramide glucosyltransferase
VGLVTCLYRGEAHGGLWARLAAMAIDYRFLPDVLVGLALGLARPCFGSTIALRRETLRAIGGFDAFVEQLADDYAIGAAVRAAGLTVAIPPLIVRHGFSERTAFELLRHELRWARTLRAASPAGYAGLAITHPLPCALSWAILGRRGDAWLDGRRGCNRVPPCPARSG